MSNNVLAVLLLLLCITSARAWNFYDLTKSPPGVIDLTATVTTTKNTLYNTQGSFVGVTLGDLSSIQAKIVVARTNENSHTHNNDVFSVVFEGAGTMNTYERAMFAGSGDSFVVPANTLHFTVNHINVSLDAAADAARDYVVFLSSFSPQPYSRYPQVTTLQPTTPPADLSTEFRAGKFVSIEGAQRDVEIGSVNTFIKHLISTNTSGLAALKLTNAYPLSIPVDALYVVMEGSAVLTVGGNTYPLETKDFFVVPNNTLGLITPSTPNTRILLNTAPSFFPPTPTVAPTPAPTILPVPYPCYSQFPSSLPAPSLPNACGLSFSLVTRGDAWQQNGAQERHYDFIIENKGNKPITALYVTVTGDQVGPRWNICPIGQSVTFASDLWGGIAQGTKWEGNHGFIARGLPLNGVSASVYAVQC